MESKLKTIEEVRKKEVAQKSADTLKAILDRPELKAMQLLKLMPTYKKDNPGDLPEWLEPKKNDVNPAELAKKDIDGYARQLYRNIFSPEPDEIISDTEAEIYQKIKILCIHNGWNADNYFPRPDMDAFMKYVGIRLGLQGEKEISVRQPEERPVIFDSDAMAATLMWFMDNSVLFNGSKKFASTRSDFQGLTSKLEIIKQKDSGLHLLIQHNNKTDFEEIEYESLDQSKYRQDITSGIKALILNSRLTNLKPEDIGLKKDSLQWKLVVFFKDNREALEHFLKFYESEKTNIYDIEQERMFLGLDMRFDKNPTF